MSIRWKKAVSVGLCTCLAMAGLSGCSKKESFDTAAAAITVNDEDVSAGLLKFATHFMQSQYETMYANFGYTGIINQDIYGTGTTLGDSIKDSMVEELTRLVLAEQHMEEYGVALSDEQKQAAADAAAAFIADNDEEILEKMSADEETVARYLELVTIQSLMEDAMTEDVDTEVSDEEAAQRKIQYTLFTVAAEKETEAESEEDTENDAEAVSESDSEAVTEAGSEEGTEAVSEADSEVAVTEAADTEAESDAPETAALTENDTTKTQTAGETESETAAEESETAAEADTEADSEAVEDESAAGEEASTEVESETETESETEDAETREARAKAKVKAEALLEKLKAGEDFETASEEVDPDAYCGTTTFGADDSSRAELLEATEGLADGTLVETPVETSTGFYVVRLETQVDREATDAEKENIVSQRKSDRISELYEEWEGDSEISSDSDILASIVFDFSLTVEMETETEAETGAEAATEAVTEAGSEAATEAVTEAGSEAATEAVTEAGSEAVTEAETEAGSEAATEAETEAGSEAATEAETEAESETETE